MSDGVCHFEGRIRGVLYICNRAAHHPPPHMLDIFKKDKAYEPPGLRSNVVTITSWPTDAVPVPLPLAQRILAALEREAETSFHKRKLAALIAELRAIVERPR